MAADDLRKRAEEAIGGDTDNTLVHDLKVHQIELELQNEELRRAYGRLEDISRGYMDLFEHAPTGFFVVDSNGLVIRSNQAFRHLVCEQEPPSPGHADMGKPFSSYLTEESGTLWNSRFHAVFAQPEKKRLDLEVAGCDGRRVIRLTAEAIDSLPPGTRRKGKEAVLLCVAIDVTAETAAREEAESLVREKELLLRELRHRTQNHLHTTLSMLSFQGAHTTVPAVAEALQGAEQRIRSMLVINDLLSHHTGHERIDLGTYLASLTDKISEIHRKSTDVEVEVSFAAASVSADTAFVVGLILNELLTNAYKYAFPRGEAGLVLVTLAADDPSTAEFVVADTGIGYSPENRVADDGEPGGFGLYLVEGLVEQLGGSMTVSGNDRSGKSPGSSSPGTRTVVRFPLRQ
jgi:two-component sensor histidine kinase/PAS domain-containing protein